MNTNTKSSALSRRSFVQRAGVIGIAGLSLPAWMPRMAFAASPDAASSGDTLVCIFLRGGMDGLSALVPYNEAGYHDVRPTIKVPYDKVTDLDGQFGLHPAMASLRDIWQQGDLAAVCATGSTDSTRSHFDAMDFMERGTPGEKIIQTGWIGRHLESTAKRNQSIFRAVGMGKMLQTSLRGPISAIALQSIADFHLKGRADEISQVQQTLQNLYTISQENGNKGKIYTALEQQANQSFDAIDILKNVNPMQYTSQYGAEYAEDQLGQGLGQIAKLIRSQVGLEVACVDAGGWDTHDTMGTYDEGEMTGLLANLAKNLTAFYTDMQDQMSGITVMVMSEFGRRVKENGSQGTDHGHGNCMFLMGGGIAGGQVHGQWPGLAPEQLDRGDLAITTDFRDVLSEVVSVRLANPLVGQVFPNYAPTYLGVTASSGEVTASSLPSRAEATEAPAQDNQVFMPLVFK